MKLVLEVLDQILLTLWHVLPWLAGLGVCFAVLSRLSPCNEGKPWWEKRGLVTDLLRDLLAETASSDRRIACCGPEVMMEAVAHLASERGVACQVSLETPMACGIGICFSCVTKVKTAEGWDYRRVCVEGPVFDSACLAW